MEFHVGSSFTLSLWNDPTDWMRVSNECAVDADHFRGSEMKPNGLNTEDASTAETPELVEKNLREQRRNKNIRITNPGKKRFLNCCYQKTV